MFSLADGAPRGFPLRPAEGFPTGVALASAEGGYAVVLADIGGGLQAFDLDTGEPRWDRASYDEPVQALTTGELGTRKVVVGGDGKGRVRIWDLTTGRAVSGPHLVPELDGGITAIGIVPSWDGGRLVLAGRKRVPPATEKERAGLDRAQQLLAAMFGEMAQDTPLSTEPRMLTIGRPGPADAVLQPQVVMRPQADVTEPGRRRRGRPPGHRRHRRPPGFRLAPCHGRTGGGPVLWPC